MHRVLKRQLRRLKVDPAVPPDPDSWAALLASTSRFYDDADDARYRLERSLTSVSDEMTQLYADLEKSSETRLAVQRDRLQSILNAIGAGLCALDAKGRVVDANPAAIELLGASVEELSGRAILEDFDLEGVAPAAALERLHRVGKFAVNDGTLNANGSARPVSVSLTPLRQGAEVAGSVLLFADMTKQVEQQQKLATALDDAKEAVRVKSEFLANMSHEIRTPMNGIIGTIGLLLHSQLDRTQREYAEIIESSAEALLKLLNDILALSKLEAGKIVIEHHPFKMWRCIEEVCSLMAKQAHVKGLGLEVHIDPSTPDNVRGDSGRLRQVLLNLIGNALKFTSSGLVSVRCRPKPGTDKTAGVVEFEVQDTGLGIPKAVQASILQPFTQADASTTRRFGGTGLGLTICRHLVDAMDGELSFESVEGEGSTFRFYCRLRPVATTHDPSLVAGLDGIRVLVVDDLAVNRRICADYLRHWQAQSVEAESLRQAIEKLDACSPDEPFDVAVLDYQMPDSDGLEVARAIRAHARYGQLPIIVLTSVAQFPSDVDLDALDLSAMLHKPMRHTALRDAIAEATKRFIDDGVSRRPPPASRPRVGGVRTVLLVEDHHVNRRVACALLGQLGYQVETATNGYEALAALDRHSYDLVLMDCQMPEMDGYEATRRIRLRPGPDAGSLIVALTANAMRGDVEKCIAAGMDDYMSKPITLQGLREKLNALLGTTEPAAPAFPAVQSPQ